MIRLVRYISVFITSLSLLLCTIAVTNASDWPPRSDPIISGSMGYYEIPNVAVPREKNKVYKAIFQAQKENPNPNKIAPQLARVAYQVNGLKNAKLSNSNIKFAMIFFGSATDALLINSEYKSKYNEDNPNLKLIESLKKYGVQILVCGQYLAAHDIPLSSITTEARVSESATLVLIEFQNKGYSLITD